MQPITSKFSDLYLAKIFIFSALALIFIVLCFSNSIDSNGEVYYLVVFETGILISIISLFGLIALFQTFKLTLTNEEIIKQKIFSKRKEIIKYQDIVKIESKKHRYVGKAGYINDGSFSRVLTLESGKLFEISPYVFENYNEIANFILNKYQNKP
jgi:hypothetical protein